MLHELVNGSPLVAAGWALVYLVFGGGLIGAAVIFYALGTGDTPR
jgi:hypothetical protein